MQVDEKNISTVLADLAKLAVSYTHIEINKPTLEDYFLHIAAMHPSLPKGYAETLETSEKEKK